MHHSKSPEIQNAAFRALGMDAVYVALEVPAPRLQQALEGLHAARALGLNLTAPHKEAAFSLTHERTSDAQAARAVNTLRWEADGWRGHATDGTGFLAWVAEAAIEVRGRRVLVLGAGGAARAIVPKLLGLSPASIHVVSRSGEHARSLARLAQESGASTRVTSTGLGEEPQGASGGGKADPGGDWELLVRAVSVEAISAEEERLWREHARGAAVLDLNYGARAEDARAMARTGGLRYEDGGALLVHQGAASFEFWTGKKAPLEAMRDALRAAG